MHIAGQYGFQYNAVTRVVLRSAPRRYAYISASRHRRHAHSYVPDIKLNINPNPKAKEIAVLGGGVTGLATAYSLQKTIPDATITIYDRQKILGGWLVSEKVAVDGGEVLFEWGPRTLRPDMSGAGLATFMLLCQLDITREIIFTMKGDTAGKNRFVYYPDHLVKMPGPNPGGNPLVTMGKALYTMLTEPLFKGVLPALFSEPAVAPRSSGVADESVGHFIRRRFGVEIADNLLSAVFHGIYAGDIYKLSAQTLLPALWYAETRDSEGNGVLAEFTDLFFKGQGLRAYRDIYFQNLIATAKDFPTVSNNKLAQLWSTIMNKSTAFTFGPGSSFLTTNLKQALDKSEKVKYETETVVDSLKFDSSSNQISISASKADGPMVKQNYDYVVSTLAPNIMRNEMEWSQNEQSTKIKFEEAVNQVNKAVSVMVVNLYYSEPDLIPAKNRGFGYLIPRSVPLEQNPERALGVIFASETSGTRGPEAQTQDQDRTVYFGQDTAPGTKLTVMMGGHWWDGWQDGDYPTESEAVEMAKAVLARHLNISQSPAVAKARFNKNCIPQYPVGYRQRMATLHEVFLDKFKGHLKMAGPWWQGGVGINDCTRKARLTAFSIREQWDDKTGLEEYTEPEKWVLVDRRSKTVMMDPMQR